MRSMQANALGLVENVHLTLGAALALTAMSGSELLIGRALRRVDDAAATGPAPEESVGSQ